MKLYRTALEAVHALQEQLSFTVDPHFLQHKLDVHRTFMFVMVLLFSGLGVITWSMDDVIDPVGARGTVPFRLAYLWLVLPALAVRRIVSYRRLAVVVLICGAVVEIQSIAVLKLLSNGIVEGIALFLYFPFAAVTICLGLSVLVSIAFIVMVTVLPPLLALMGWIPGFRQALYAVLILPEAAIMVLISMTFAWGYRKRFLLEQALERASNTDPLTGVANRRHFHTLMLRELARCERLSKPCALLMLDIDHFKRINDGHGHPTGDRAIVAVADLCMEHSRASDVVARLGGEEFAVLLPESGDEEARQHGERIRQQVEKLNILSEAGDDVRWTVSVGAVSVRPLPTQDRHVVSERMISAVDAALYEAKNSGRNRVMLGQVH